MLVGRELECAELAAALTSARDGSGGALVLVGDAGIGKTTLLGWLRERAAATRVLEMRGVEADAELPYADLADLLTPIVDRLDELPDAHAVTLASALGLGPPGPVDRFTAGVAALGLLTVAAEDGPLVLLVDDLQWIDAASHEALAFGARRLGSVPVVLVAAARPPGTGLPRARVLPLRPLESADAALVLAQAADAIAPDVARRLLAAARGNPLALVELPRLLTAAQLAGRETLAEPIPTGNGLERAFAAQLAPLTPAARLAVLVAAADTSGTAGTVLAACRALELEDGVLAEAEDLGLVTVEGNALELRHPLVRSAAYHGADASDRRRAHAALAAAETDPDRRAWHLAAAAAGPSDVVAAELDAAGARALERGAFAAAAAALERAASLTASEPARGDRLLRAASALEVAGDLVRSDALARAAEPLLDDPELHRRLIVLRGRLLMAVGRMEEGAALLLEEAGRIAERDAGAAAEMLSFAANLAVFRLDSRSAVALTARARSLGASDRVRTVTERAAFALARAMAGEPSAPALLVELADEAANDVQAGQRLAASLAWPLVWVEEYAVARTLLTRSIELQRAGGSLSHLPKSLSELSELDFRVGRWVPALAAAHEALERFEETGQHTELGAVAATTARIEAALGLDADCRRHASAALAADSARGLLLASAYAGAALGLLELGRGDPEAAVLALEPVERIVLEGGIGEPWLVQWAPDLVEACSRAGRAARAAEVLERFETQARATRRISARAAAARCRGLLAADGELDEPFREALALHERVPTPFERARTELAWGERLRRAGRRTEAHARLASALQTFERLGAEPWSERARVELRASGRAVRAPEQRTEDALTPQELQVAAIVAGGATNREAAAALFLSVKTIEFHLGHVYGKLGIRSRTELARTLDAPR